MRYPRAFFGACFFNDGIITAGGVDENKVETAVGEIFFYKKNFWADLPSLNVARSSLSLEILAGSEYLFALGGYPIGAPIEMMLLNKGAPWTQVNVEEGSEYFIPFFAGTFSYRDAIYIFGGGQKFSDTCNFL